MEQTVTTQDSTTEWIFTDYLYSALSSIQSAHTWITQLYLQITPCLSLFVSVHDMAPPLIEATDTRLQACSLLYGPLDPERTKGWVGLVVTLSGWFTHVGDHSSAIRRAQYWEVRYSRSYSYRPTFYRWLLCHGTNLNQYFVESIVYVPTYLSLKCWK